MDRAAHRVLSLRHPGPRPRDPGRARARRRRPFPRPARAYARRPWRLRFELWCRHPRPDLLGAARRRVQDAGGVRRSNRRLQQHGADRRLSRRGAAGSLLCARAARGQGVARTPHRSRRDPAAQPHSRERDAVQDAGRADLRLRRFSQAARACAANLRLCKEALARPRHRHRLLCRIIRGCPVAPRRRHGRARRLLRIGADTRRPGWRHHRASRHA